VAQADLEQIPVTADAVGTVHAHESAVLSAQVTAKIAAVLVQEGDQVRAGQVLVRLDDAQPRAEADRVQAAAEGGQHAVEMAQSESALADSTLARYRMLRDRKSVSAQEYDEVERRAQVSAAQLQVARAQLSAAQAAVTSSQSVADYSRLTAPFAGIVTARLMDPGTMAAPGVPVLELDKVGPLQLDVNVDESVLSTLHPGMSLPLAIPSAFSQPITGQIAAIVPAADSNTHSFLVKIKLPASPKLRSGMYGTAAIGTSTRPALLLPQSAVVTHGSLTSVWVLDANHVASLRYVTLGAIHSDRVEALSGIAAEETVVLKPGDRELGGSRVEVQP
jgi:RND family efflux transporter MFP subunit